MYRQRMTAHPRFMTVLILSLLSLLVAACGGEAGADAAASVPTVVVTAVVDPANEGLVARVNGEEITREQFDQVLSRTLSGSTAASQDALALQILNTMIEQRLINQSAADMGIVVSDEEVAAEIETLRNSIGSTDESAWTSWLEANEYTEADLSEAIYDNLITNKVRDTLGQNLGGTVQQVHARHILVRTEAEALTIKSRLDNGEDFAIVAAEVSLDNTTKSQGGDLGWFTIDELMDRSLADVAFGLQPGEIAGPVTSRLGYHMLQTLEFGELPVEPERMPMLMESMFINWLDEQLENATIERYIN